MKLKIHHLSSALAVFMLLNSAYSHAATTTSDHTTRAQHDFKIERISKKLTQLIPSNAQLKLLSNASAWAEGPIVLQNGQLIWSDIVNNRVLTWNLQQQTQTWLSPAQFQNGHAIDQQGRLLAASHGKRAIERLDHQGKWEILVDLYGDKKLNSPNDLIVDRDGEIWFTDPTFGIKKANEGYGGNAVIGGEYSYRFNPKTQQLTQLVTPDVHTPNGIALSPDQKTLYISDAAAAHDANHQSRHIVAYALDQHKNLSKGHRLIDLKTGIPDGLKVDAKGNIWATSGNKIFIISAQGEQLGVLEFSHPVANLVFATTPDQQKVIYITGDRYLYQLNVLVDGALKAPH
ncbi:SMP-30/gluconolactonase/LRE family protein [Acinetobacter larvae]|uniref:SMP-30/Gluconolactonase/LRE-like region domain-containing protein n=1 Tax=Acinetobacter larvae TaxID=1789224 RepID=A0A1B2M037_9GAMM|nr:SMP-30/gluconolactonase/LRE family protein [Acinetobacter larvae]AOA58403.1 hypothetical protein BFG52_08580 [Acinetobacter larvae]